MGDRIKNNPALLVNLIVAAAAVGSAFGIHISDAQTARLVGLAVALVAVLGGVTIRALAVPARSAERLRAQLDRIVWQDL